MRYEGKKPRSPWKSGGLGDVVTHVGEIHLSGALTLQGGEDVRALWHANLQRLGLKDDGTGEERVRAIRAGDAVPCG